MNTQQQPNKPSAADSCRPPPPKERVSGTPNCKPWPFSSPSKKEDVSQGSADLKKWYRLIAFAGLVFYLVFPAYEIFDAKDYSLKRINRVTGKVERLHYDGKWERVDRPWWR